MIKLKPHHDLAAVKARFATVEGLVATTTALQSAARLGFLRSDIVAAVQALERGNFKKSETAHSPPNSKVWHDTYFMSWRGLDLYLKFAGEALIDVTLTSFKER